MAKHRETFKKTKPDLETEEDYDEELEELRWARYLVQMEEEEKQRQKEKFERRARYFFADGSCRAHDWLGCRECSHYAAGRCPSYWEEFY